MNERIRIALEGLPPEGPALKRHILDRLLTSAPSRLTAAQVADCGPKRTDASVRYALTALQRIGVVTRTRSEEAQRPVARFGLTPGTEDIVRAFLMDEADGERGHVSPLPALPRYQRLIEVLRNEPGRAFTVTKLCDRVRRKEPAVRRAVQELYEAGYVTRELPGTELPGRPQFHYRLDPRTEELALALLRGTAW